MRILIYGVTGSGKSTLAARLSRETGLPLTLVDELTWKENWEEVPADKQREIFANIAAGDTWILDTAYSKWIEEVLPRTELIVGLDYPRSVSFWRLFRRSIRRAVTKEPVCNGNTESWRKLLSMDSILVWHFKSFDKKRARIRKWNSEWPERVIVVSHPRDLEAAISEVKLRLTNELA